MVTELFNHNLGVNCMVSDYRLVTFSMSARPDGEQDHLDVGDIYVVCEKWTQPIPKLVEHSKYGPISTHLYAGELSSVV